MASNSVVTNTGQQVTITTDLTKIFLWNNRYDSGSFTNGTGAILTIPAGTLLGRIGATNKLAIHSSAAVDGSQFPIGVLADDYIVAIGATVNLVYCNEGDVAVEKIILSGGDTMTTLITTRTIYDRIGSDSVGIKLVGSTANLNYDN